MRLVGVKEPQIVRTYAHELANPTLERMISQMESKMDEMFIIMSAFVTSSKTNSFTNMSSITENAHAHIETQVVEAHVDPILEKPITMLDADFESQGTSTNHEKVSE
jgi:hypothetical protein